MSTPHLTPRECEVMDLLADGLSREQIAQRLGISPETVKRHLASIRVKRDAPSVTVAAYWVGYERGARSAA